jgi:hypothetical protein
MNLQDEKASAGLGSGWRGDYPWMVEDLLGRVALQRVHNQAPGYQLLLIISIKQPPGENQMVIIPLGVYISSSFVFILCRRH